MGKLGGRELNFSSDVDLIYLYASRDENEWPIVEASEYFRRLSQKITSGLNKFTGEGYVYRVDLRLRPEGAGNIVDSYEAFQRYYKSRVATWERLALLKAWPVAGSRVLGRDFLNMASTHVYDPPLDEKAIDDLRSMKRKIDEQMSLRAERKRNVKLGTGGIREIELIVQALQVRHGNQNPTIRDRNTLKALITLCQSSLISVDECNDLTRAYIFLRDVENKLQMANDAQTHALPREPEELTMLARTLGYSDNDDGPAARRFLLDYERYTKQVNDIFENRILSGQL